MLLAPKFSVRHTSGCAARNSPSVNERPIIIIVRTCQCAFREDIGPSLSTTHIYTVIAIRIGSRARILNGLTITSCTTAFMVFSFRSTTPSHIYDSASFPPTPSGCILTGGPPTIISRLLSQDLRLLHQQDRSICLRDSKKNYKTAETGEHREDPIEPSPAGGRLPDVPSDYGPDSWACEGRKRENGHR